MLSGRGPCDELITRPEESYQLWCVVCDLETSRIGAPYIYDVSSLRVNGDMEWYGMLKHKPLTGQERGKHYCQNALVKVCVSAACKCFVTSALVHLNLSITHPQSKCDQEMYLLIALSLFAGVENGWCWIVTHMYTAH